MIPQTIMLRVDIVLPCSYHFVSYVLLCVAKLIFFIPLSHTPYKHPSFSSVLQVVMPPLPEKSVSLQSLLLVSL